jgi:hypothetical protein
MCMFSFSIGSRTNLTNSEKFKRRITRRQSEK